MALFMDNAQVAHSLQELDALVLELNVGENQHEAVIECSEHRMYWLWFKDDVSGNAINKMDLPVRGPPCSTAKKVCTISGSESLVAQFSSDGNLLAVPRKLYRQSASLV